MKKKPFYVVVRGLFKGRELGNLREFISSFEHDRTTADRLGYTGNLTNYSAGIPYRAILKSHKKMWECASKLNSKIWRVLLNGKVSFGVYTSIQYRRGNFINRHVDFDAFEGQQSTKLSCLLMLSERSRYQGGDLLFDNRSKIISLDAGDAAVFPGYTLHEVTRVSKGLRHTLNGWYSGPEFK